MECNISTIFQSISEYNGEDRFLTRIGVGGLINMEKVTQAHLVLNDIQLFHNHAKMTGRPAAPLCMFRTSVDSGGSERASDDSWEKDRLGQAKLILYFTMSLTHFLHP